MTQKLDIELINQHGRKEKLQIRNSSEVCLLELIEEAGLSSPFGCRVGSCGTCVAEILEGSEHLDPLSQNEEDTLSRVAPNSRNPRLLCRVSLKPNTPTSARLLIQKIKIV